LFSSIISITIVVFSSILLLVIFHHHFVPPSFSLLGLLAIGVRVESTSSNRDHSPYKFRLQRAQSKIILSPKRFPKVSHSLLPNTHLTSTISSQLKC
jgi:hypothetical protein